MKTSFLLIGTLSAGMALGWIGCSKKPDARSELEKAASALEKAAPAPQAATAPTPTTTSPSPAPAAAVSAEPPPAQQLSSAIAAYKAGNLEDAVTRLQKLRATPVMAPEQRIALNDAMAAVMSEVYALAAKGDGRAIQAAKQYEQMQTRPR